ncbi:DUF222 domain-containing protein [Microtetraspora sp. AC03309]|nr:HNH endonuclease signature motif containing protein [Microtetraspora sp. AC03309]MCC5582183.1 DUF222 domain-containing protein [Microtetraspora sp. AC03309]
MQPSTVLLLDRSRLRRLVSPPAAAVRPAVVPPDAEQLDPNQGRRAERSQPVKEAGEASGDASAWDGIWQNRQETPDPTDAPPAGGDDRHTPGRGDRPDPGLAGAAVTDLLRRAEEIAADVQGIPPDTEAAMAEIVALARAIDLAEAALAARARVAEAGKGHHLFGRRSIGAWLARATGSRAARANERLTLARQLPRLPQVAARLTDGSLTFGYATTIASATRHLDDAETGLAEPILLTLADAPAATVEDVARAGQTIIETIDPDGRLARAAAKTERQHLTIADTLDGMGRITGLLDPELTMRLKTWLEPLAVPTDSTDTRSHARRMADALAIRLSGGGRRTVLHVQVTEQTLTGESDAPAHLEDGTAIPAADARRMAYTAELRRVLRDARGIVTDFGRSRRLASADQREAIIARYRSCCREGCDVPAYLAEIDHIEPWYPSGRTDLGNLAPLCAPDNKWKSRHPDKVEVIDQPDGTVTMRFHRYPKHRPRAWARRQ